MFVLKWACIFFLSFRRSSDFSNYMSCHWMVAFRSQILRNRCDLQCPHACYMGTKHLKAYEGFSPWHGTSLFSTRLSGMHHVLHCFHAIFLVFVSMDCDLTNFHSVWRLSINLNLCLKWIVLCEFTLILTVHFSFYNKVLC